MSEQFPKSHRLLTRRQFQRMMRGSKRYVGVWTLIDCRPSRLGHSRLGLTVSRKFGKAWARNRFKRMVREVFRRHQEIKLSGLDIHIQPRSQALQANHQNIFLEIKQACEAQNK